MDRKLLAVAVLVPILAFAGGELKKVCHAEKNGKGKEVQVCKEIKVHAKLEGTKVPSKK